MEKAARMKNLVLVILAILMVDTHVEGQVTEDANYVEAKASRESFPEDDVVATRSQTTYDFLVDRTMGLTVKQKEVATYLATRSNAELVLRSYSNNHTLIQSHSLLDIKRKKIDHNTFCGHSVSPGIFYSDGQLCMYQTYLRQVGQTANYETEILYTNAMYMVHAGFIQSYPSKERRIIFNIPDGVDIELVEFNFEGYNIVKSKQTSAGRTTYIFTLAMANAYPKEDHLPGSLHILPHVLVLSKGYIDAKGVRQTVLASTDDLYRWYASLTAQLNTDYESFKPLVTELTRSLRTDKEKMAAIYYWVQDNIKYIAFEDGVAAFKPADAKTVYYNRFGDCKGMANLTKAMLSLAGLDARLTWVGTDRIPYTYNLPSIAVDNHMICTVYLEGKEYILDATEKFNPVGEYAERIQGKEVLIEHGDSYKIGRVPVEPLESTQEVSSVQLGIEGDKLHGKAITVFRGEMKRKVLQILPTLTTEDQQRFLKHVISGESKQADFHIERGPATHRDSATFIRYRFDLQNRIFKNNNELYVDLDIDKAYSKGKIGKDRKAPYRFDERINKSIRTEFTLPKGYRVTDLTPPLHITNEYFEFDLRYEITETTLVYKKQIRIANPTLPVKAFDDWNKAIAKVNEFYNNQIILKLND